MIKGLSCFAAIVLQMIICAGNTQNIILRCENSDMSSIKTKKMEEPIDNIYELEINTRKIYARI